MTDTREATPRPWVFIDCTKEASMQYARKWVIKAGSKQIASSSWNNDSPYYPTMLESQGNAALIVRAVNHFDEVVEVLRRLRLAARLLAQNAEGCAVNHHGADFDVNGVPGWLADAIKDIEAAEALLSKLEASHG